MKRRLIADPHNAEVGIPIKRPRKVNSKQGNSKDNSHIFINTQNIFFADTIILTVNINVLAPLVSVFSYRRAELLANRPLSVLSDNSNNQKDKTPNNAILKMLYQQLEL